MNEPYKVELVKEHSDKGEHITFYDSLQVTLLLPFVYAIVARV